MLRKELSRAIFNKRMALVIFLMLLLLYLSSYQSLLSSHFFIDREAKDLTPESLNQILEIGRNTYHIWLNAFNYTQTIFVLAIIFPYTASFVYEKKMHFHYFSINRIGHFKYRLYKLFANSIAGGLALLIPGALYFIGLSVFFENKILDPFEYYPDGLFSHLFSSEPMLYILFVLAMHFILGFSIAIFAMGVTSFFSKVVYVYALPFVLYLSYDIFISNIKIMEKFSTTTMYYLISSLELTLINIFTFNLILILIGVGAFYINFKVEFKNGI